MEVVEVQIDGTGGELTFVQLLLDLVVVQAVVALLLRHRLRLLLGRRQKVQPVHVAVRFARCALQRRPHVISVWETGRNEKQTRISQLEVARGDSEHRQRLVDCINRRNHRSGCF